MAPNPWHCAVLLAAGGSARLGQPKQMLRRDGESLIHRAARLLAQTRPARLLVIVNDAAMADQLKGLPVDILINADWRSGLSSSVRLAARTLVSHAGPTLFATVDQCRLEARHLDALLAAEQTHVAPPPGAEPGQADIVSQYDDESFGIPALVSPATLARARTLTGDRGFGQVWHGGEARLVRVLAPDLGFDLDTPAQLATALRRGWIDGGTQEPGTPATHRPRGRRALRQDRVRADVIATALPLFAHQGFDATTMDAIATAAGLSRRTLFRHFPAKGDLVAAWMNTMTHELRAALARPHAAPHTNMAAEEHVAHAFQAAIAALTAPPAGTTSGISTGTPTVDVPIAAAILRLAETTPALQPYTLRHYAAWEDIIADAWAAGMGVSAPADSFLAARVFARSAVAVFRAALDVWLRDGGRPALQPLVEDAFRLQRTLVTTPRSETHTPRS